MYISASSCFNPRISIQAVTRGGAFSLSRSFDSFDWSSESCVRDFTPGVVRKWYKGKGQRSLSAWASINSYENPFRIAGRTNDFVCDGKKEDGTLCTDGELEAWKQEVSVSYQQTSSRHY